MYRLPAGWHGSQRTPLLMLVVSEGGPATAGFTGLCPGCWEGTISEVLSPDLRLRFGAHSATSWPWTPAQPPSPPGTVWSDPALQAEHRLHVVARIIDDEGSGAPRPVSRPLLRPAGCPADCSAGRPGSLLRVKHSLTKEWPQPGGLARRTLAAAGDQRLLEPHVDFLGLAHQVRTSRHCPRVYGKPGCHFPGACVLRSRPGSEWVVVRGPHFSGLSLPPCRPGSGTSPGCCCARQPPPCQMPPCRMPPCAVRP